MRIRVPSFYIDLPGVKKDFKSTITDLKNMLREREKYVAYVQSTYPNAEGSGIGGNVKDLAQALEVLIAAGDAVNRGVDMDEDGFTPQDLEAIQRSLKASYRAIDAFGFPPSLSGVSALKALRKKTRKLLKAELEKASMAPEDKADEEVEISSQPF